MQPYTVLILHQGNGPPHVFHVEARGPVAAYREAVEMQQIYEALANDIGQPHRLSLEEAMTDWPLLMVCEGHIEIDPILSPADVFEAASQELELATS